MIWSKTHWSPEPKSSAFLGLIFTIKMFPTQRSHLNMVSRGSRWFLISNLKKQGLDLIKNNPKNLVPCDLVQNPLIARALHSAADKGFRGVSNSKKILRRGLLHVSKSLALNYWSWITSNFGTLIKRKCFIESLPNLEASEVPLYVIKNVKN